MKKNYLQTLILFLFIALLIPFDSYSSAEKDDNGWTIVNQWPVNNNASGLAWDGEFFYIGSYGGGNGPKMYKFNPQTGENELLFTGPQSAAYGLTYDGQHLWTIDRVSPSSTMAYALQLDMQGNVVSQFDLVSHYMSGIAWDDGDFWVATYFPNPGTIHHVDGQGNQTSSFVPPDNQPWDLSLHGDSLWIVDYWNGSIFLVLTDGTLVESFPYPDHRAGGVFFDGTYLWYTGITSMGHSTLYKVDPWGTGTPVINAPYSHNFGNVTVGSSGQWNMNISNPGTGNLVIDNMELSASNQAFSFQATYPITIEPGASHTIQVTFSPQEIDIYNEHITIFSNDPANPQVDVLLAGNGLFDGAYLFTQQQLIDFGNVRLGSTSRLYLEVKNMGNTALVFDDIEFSNDFFYWDDSVEFPISVNPVQERSIPFWFFPSDPGVINAEMELVFNNTDQSPHVINVKGFSQQQEYPLGTVLWEHQLTGSYDYHARAIMSVPDVTGDGVDELLVGTRDRMIRLFNGNSSGNPDLLWERDLGVPEYPKTVAVIDDINDDGYQDIVIGTAWGDRSVTALSAKTGEILWRFQTHIYGNGGWVYMVDVKYDYNGNGYRDVLAATGDDGDETGPKRVFLLNGLNGEIIWEAALNVAFYSVLAVEDFTGDGIPDVVAGAGSAANQGKVFGINGANGNVVWELTTSGTSVWALEQLDDITGDGVKDVIAGSFNGFYYLLDATDGEIVFMGSLGSVLIMEFWLAGDLNNDGYVDVIPAHSSVPNVVAIDGHTGQTLWSTQVPDQPWSIAPIKDITGDGVTDIVVGTLYQNNFIKVLSGSDGTIVHSAAMPQAVDAVGVMPDIAGDNSMEFIGGARNGYLGVFSGGPVDLPETFDITFHVTDDADPANDIENAKIEITQGGTTVYTNSEGIAVMQLSNGTYFYTVTHSGYATTGGTIVVNDEQQLVEVVMEAIYFEVTFHVTDDEDPANNLENAMIEVLPSGAGALTGADGQAILQLGAGNHSYTVSLEGYFTQEGNFEVEDDDLLIVVVLAVDDVGVEQLSQSGRPFCYPNPLRDFTDIVFYLNNEAAVVINFYDITGKIIKVEDQKLYPSGKNKYRWNGQDAQGRILPDGMYFFEIITPDYDYKSRLMILRN